MCIFELSTNSIIAACLSRLLYILSPVRKWWSSVLYVNLFNKCSQLVLPIVFIIHVVNIVFMVLVVSCCVTFNLIELWLLITRKVIIPGCTYKTMFPIKLKNTANLIYSFD